MKLTRTARIQGDSALRYFYLYPGGYSTTGAANAFCGSGRIRSMAVTINSDLPATIDDAKLIVYNLQSYAALTGGKPLILGTPPKKFQVPALLTATFLTAAANTDPYIQALATNGDVPEALITGMDAGAIAWQADILNYTAGLATEYITTSPLHFDDLDIPCPAGMLVVVDKGQDGPAGTMSLSVTYEPWTSGYTRFKQAMRGVSWINERVDAAATASSADPVVVTVAAGIIPTGMLVGQKFAVDMADWISGSPENPAGRYEATYVSALTFTIPVDTSSVLPTGGSVTIPPKMGAPTHFPG